MNNASNLPPGVTSPDIEDQATNPAVEAFLNSDEFRKLSEDLAMWALTQPASRTLNSLQIVQKLRHCLNRSLGTERVLWNDRSS